MTPSICLPELFVAAWPTILTMDLSRYLTAAGVLVAILASSASQIPHAYAMGSVRICSARSRFISVAQSRYRLNPPVKENAK